MDYVHQSDDGVVAQPAECHWDFIEDFRELSSFGATSSGGVDREAGSDADAAQRRWLQGKLESLGMTVEYDSIGNQYGYLEKVPGAPYVLIGSHLDSQPTAGRFDGAYGVLAAAHVAARLASQTSTLPFHEWKYNLCVVNWFNEEGSRFSPSMMGSSVYTGKLKLEDALKTTDRQGISVHSELLRHDFIGDGSGPEAAYYAEIHIEQGRQLENSKQTIGFVTASWAARKYQLTLLGEQAHSGATAMADRQDALYAASRLIVFTRELADRFPDLLHTAVSQIDVYPNSPVTVASRVDLLLDLRSPDSLVIEEARDLLQREFSEVEADTGVEIVHHLSHSWNLNPFQPAGVELARSVAEDLSIPGGEILTVAGHDSTNLKDIVPSIMLFVPSVDGISHHHQEFTSDEDALAGLEVFAEVTSRLLSGAYPIAP